MDLRAFLLRRTLPRPFVVTGVGGRDARLAVERLIRLRGWDQALSPGEANMLVLCAPPRHGLDDVVARLWDQLPSPRASAHVADADDADRLLDVALATLVDPDHQRADVSTRSTLDPSEHPMAGHDTGEHGVHEMHSMAGHGGHAGHDMGSMPMPGGIPMADRGEDRDGLKLDQLHLPLGPALPDWPAGLVVRLTLQGDVVQETEVTIRAGAGLPAGARSRGPVARLDSLQRLLFVAGWPAAAMAARRLRDDLVGGTEVSTVHHQYRRWAHRVRRSRLLRWSTDGVGVLGSDAPEELRGDATARWMRWLDNDVERDAIPAPRAALDVLPSLLVGQELAAARLTVASLDPDIDTILASGDEALAHG